MIITVLGGSAHSTPALFSFLAAQADLPPLEFRLVGRTKNHLAAVVRATNLILHERPIAVHAFGMTTMERRHALRGADLVVIQVRVGGFAGRAFDETFPHRYQMCGDEGLGPGGLSAAWRTWPALKTFLTEISSVCPQTFVLILSSPVSLLTRLACSTFRELKIAGICELPWTTLKRVCACLGLSTHELAYSYSGVNHIGWFHGLYSGDRDLVDEYASLLQNASDFPSGQLVRACGGIPLKYLRLHYEPIEALNEQRQRTLPRGDELCKIADHALQVYRDGDRAAIIAVLRRRPTPWYEDGIGPLILAFAGCEVSTPCFLSVANEQLDVMEVPHEWYAGAWQPRKHSLAPAHIQETLESFIEYERLAAVAIHSRDAQQLERALASHPWVRQRKVVPDLVREIVNQVF